MNKTEKRSLVIIGIFCLVICIAPFVFSSIQKTKTEQKSNADTTSFNNATTATRKQHYEPVQNDRTSTENKTTISSKNRSISKNKTKGSDAYNAWSYATEDDFYEDHWNDFIDFDEAEQYWNDYAD